MTRDRAGRGFRSAVPMTLMLMTMVAAVVSACGFYLEGHTPLPPAMKTPFVEASDRQSEFVQGLLRSLRVSGAHPEDEKDNASAIVHVLRDQAVRRVLSTSVQNQPTEYEVTYTVRFSVTQGDKELLAPQEVTATRNYSFDEKLLLAKGHEEALLRQDMAHDLADIVMRRLKRLPT